MNPRLFKKRCKMALQLLVSHGGDWHGFDAVRDVYAVPADELYHPGHSAPLKGTPLMGFMSGGECQEWTECCPVGSWLEVHYWTYVVPKDFDGDTDTLPSMTLRQRRERWEYGAIASGWRWRGGRVEKTSSRVLLIKRKCN